MDKVIEVIPSEWWKVIALLLFAGFIMVIKQGFAILLKMVKSWLEEQKVEFSDLREIVSNLVKMAERQDEKNKTFDRRLDDHDDDIRDLRKTPAVKY